MLARDCKSCETHGEMVCKRLMFCPFSMAEKEELINVKPSRHERKKPIASPKVIAFLRKQGIIPPQQGTMNIRIMVKDKSKVIIYSKTNGKKADPLEVPNTLGFHKTIKYKYINGTLMKD